MGVVGAAFAGQPRLRRLAAPGIMPGEELGPSAPDVERIGIASMRFSYSWVLSLDR